MTCRKTLQFSVYFLKYTYEKKGLNFSSTRVLIPHDLTHLAELVTVTLAFLTWKLIGSAIELNSSSVAYISVLLEDVIFLTMLKISASCLLRFYSFWWSKIQKLKFKKRAPVIWFAKFNYLENSDSLKSWDLSRSKISDKKVDDELLRKMSLSTECAAALLSFKYLIKYSKINVMPLWWVRSKINVLLL